MMFKRALLFVAGVLLLPGVVLAASDPIKPPKFFELNKHAIPQYYYDMECIIPAEMPVFEWLTYTQWADKYERDAWDYSKISAFVEWALENCGYPSKIVLGRGTWADGGHAWVNLKIDGEEYCYEATSRRLIGPKMDALAYGYEDEFRADEILTLRRYYSSNVDFLHEWGWWIPVGEYYYVLFERRNTQIRFVP